MQQTDDRQMNGKSEKKGEDARMNMNKVWNAVGGRVNG